MCRRQPDDVGEAEVEVKKKGILKGGEEARGESAAVKSAPEAIARAAEVAADGGGVEAGVDAREEDDEVFGRDIRDVLVARGEDLGFAGFPGCDQCPIHRAASSKGIFRQPEDCTEATHLGKHRFVREDNHLRAGKNRGLCPDSDPSQFVRISLGIPEIRSSGKTGFPQAFR